jgi:hypothetical protein
MSAVADFSCAIRASRQPAQCDGGLNRKFARRCARLFTRWWETFAASFIRAGDPIACKSVRHFDVLAAIGTFCFEMFRRAHGLSLSHFPQLNYVLCRSRRVHGEPFLRLGFRRESFVMRVNHGGQGENFREKNGAHSRT